MDWMLECEPFVCRMTAELRVCGSEQRWSTRCRAERTRKVHAAEEAGPLPARPLRGWRLALRAGAVRPLG